MLPRLAPRRLAPRPRALAAAAAPLSATAEGLLAPPAFKIAVYPGDGIGKEVTAVTFRLLDQLQRRHGFALDCTWYDWGCDYYDKHGKVVPDDFLDVLRPYDAIFLGAVGFPSRVPDNETLQPLIDMRQGFDQYVCLRPARTFPGVRTPLAAQPELDLFVIRENSEGEYVSSGGRFKRGTPDEVATQTAVHTRKGVERIAGQSMSQRR
ncbi:unnamed protein product [Prorocentrum cordatum]|uniref:Isopropylmalate dehydrogenase-like domain-containing protein n=1 Tax=Prorocentrum cordatum TaxID=2364126 RepID=A0ABN9Q830_9DINO|nr:unnamed protein product [Polarella glacialis]